MTRSCRSCLNDRYQKEFQVKKLPRLALVCLLVLTGHHVFAQEQGSKPSFGTLNDVQRKRMEQLSPNKDRDFLMVNLIKFRSKAKYADDRKSDLTGRQANRLYAPLKNLGQIGASINYSERVREQIGNLSPRWDELAIVHYPSRAKFLKMVNDPDFRRRAIHKDAGVDVSQVLVTEKILWKPTGAELGADKEDAFVLAELIKYRSPKQIAEDNDVKQALSGKEAIDRFDLETNDLQRQVGATRVLRSTVEGVLIGDGRKWDEFRTIRFPSEAAYVQYLALLDKKPSTKAIRANAIENSYLLKVEPMSIAKRTALSLATGLFGVEGGTSSGESSKDD